MINHVTSLPAEGNNSAFAEAESTNTQPLLQIMVLGGATFMYNDREILLRSRKARALLAYVAMTNKGEEQRTRAAGLLWSEFSEQNARTTLRQAIHELRTSMMAVGCDALAGMRTTIALRPGSFQTDLHELMEAVAAREIPESLLSTPRLAETLLDGFDDIDTLFHGWLVARRQTLHDRLLHSLEEGYHDTTIPRRRRRRLAEAALQLDPTHEEACRVVMRTAAEDGDLGTALRAYEELYRLLGDEYDMEPSVPTQTLVAEIKQGKFDSGPGNDTPTLIFEKEVRQVQIAEHRTAEPTVPSAVPSKPALFVDKFIAAGVSSDQTHLVEGFRIELISCLARFREWYVTGTEGDLTGEYGSVPVSSRYAVTATVYQVGSILSVVMALYERPSSLAIWGERFELSLDRWSEAQQRIVRLIAATLNVQLSTERLMRLSNTPDVSLEAYDIWLRVQTVISGFRVGDWNRTAQIVAQAIERAPGFSPLYSSFSQMNNVVHFVQPGLMRTDEHVQRTLTLAQKAVALDPKDSRAQLCLGWALTFCRRYSQAELHMDVACELNPNDPHTLMSSAMFHGFKGDTERAVRQATVSIGLRLVPTLSQWGYLTNIRFLHGDYEGTVIAAERAQDGLLTMLAFRAAALAKVGRKDEAKSELARFYANVRAAWIGSTQPTDEMIGEWLLHLYPIGRAEVWQKLRDGLARVGIPVMGLAHHG